LLKYILQRLKKHRVFAIPFEILGTFSAGK
jgi:hypothetical protein